MEKGFLRGQSDNLPKLDSMMLALFYKDNTDFTTAEIRGVKAQRSARESYGDNAVGYVQVKRDGDICIIKGKMTPEHKIHTKAYTLCAIINEREEKIVSVGCEGCVAGLGGCKHAIAFLAWLHRRSEDAPVTSTKCYWKKSNLSSVGKSLKLLKLTDMGKKAARTLPPADGSARREFLELCVEKNIPSTQLMRYHCSISDMEKLAIHHLYAEFLRVGNVTPGPDEFNTFVECKITPELCKKVEKATCLQYGSPLWHELRYARITASKLYSVAHCHTYDGSLVEQILGAKVKVTEAMERGTKLEGCVRRILQRKLNCKIQKCGFLLYKDCPVFVASPDGITDDFIVEIKCPSSSETCKKYFTSDGNAPAERHFAQVQLQMLFAGKARACFCVADADFEGTQGITEVWVELDEDYCRNIICQAFKFWKKAIYPKLAH